MLCLDLLFIMDIPLKNTDPLNSHAARNLSGRRIDGNVLGPSLESRSNDWCRW